MEQLEKKNLLLLQDFFIFDQKTKLQLKLQLKFMIEKIIECFHFGGRICFNLIN